MWHDGIFVPWDEANIHIMTHGLHYASCVFEGIRVYKGKPFKLKEHMARLLKSADILNLTLKFQLDELIEIVNDLVDRQQINFGYIRPVVWRGKGKLLISAPHNQISIAIAAWETPAKYSQYQEGKDLNDGLKLCYAKWKRAPSDCIPHLSKCSANYVVGTVDKDNAVAQGFDDALMLDYRGYIAETTSANIFLVQDDKLHTPIPDCFLDGITRQSVIDIAKQNNIEVIERYILPEEFQHTQDVFLTSSASEISPVNSIERYNFSRHPITKQLYDQLMHHIMNL
ncbi:branched-chain amino acid aminotransferase [Rickettsiales endosymbiont of Stachyamoeba lipophora]|nr:branched-chain amino acid aminotransferase [Rickettsiales endosymbiont of Stachyamoeba lipophora]